MSFSFGTVCYGSRYQPFLGVLIDSIRRTHNRIPIYVEQHQDVNQSHLYYKTASWIKMLKQIPEGDTIVFLDCDMLVLRDIPSQLDPDADIHFTWKTERPPLNTGFLVVRRSDKTIRFLEEWQANIMRVCSNETLHAMAAKMHGSADQYALWEMLGGDSWPSFSESRTICYPYGKILFNPLPCEVFNQTESVPIAEHVRVLHYKGGWHKILLDEGPFTDKRPWDTSREMWQLWSERRRALDAEAAK
jgi:hypothetical protein